MRGSISRLSQKLGCGFILGEDGREACFDLSSLQGVDIRALSVEKTVEYEEHFENERLRAVWVRVASALKQIRRWGSEMRRKGSVAQLIRKPRPGYILDEDGCLVAFDESALEGLDPGELSVGDWVEYEELDRMEETRASRIKPLIRRGEE